MKIKSQFLISTFLILTLLTGWVTPAYADGLDSSSAQAATDTPTPTATDTPPAATNTPTPTNTPAGPTNTPTQTNTPLPTNTPTITPTFTPSLTPVFGRPQIVISSYTASDVAQMGKKFKLTIGFKNSGTLNAINTQAVFSSADVVPTGTGGVLALGSIPLGAQVNASQSFYGAYSTAGKKVVLIDVTLTYYDDVGTTYSEKFTLSVAARGEPVPGGGGGGVYSTATPTGVNTAQLVITSYTSSLDPLQPGAQFQLGVTVQNMGNTKAKSVTMIMGGGSSGTGSGTPQPGGVSGGGGEFTNFAPVGSSNIQSLGDVPAGGRLQVSQNLVVNVSTNPGAYPMKITFSYVNAKGEVVNDDQVITLLVYSLPNLDVSFYSPTGSLFVGQPGALPIQIVNLGKRSTVLGKMKIETTNGTVDPDSTLVGSLDPGGYFTFDSTLSPETVGSADLNITIEYTDDFNQPRTVTHTLNVTVEEASAELMPDPGMGGGTEISPATDESFLHKVWRAVLGLFGLDSAPPSDGIPTDKPLPGKEIIPLPAGGGGGKG